MWQQFLHLTWAEFRIFLREPVAVFFNLLFPLMFLVLTMSVFLPAEAVANGAINIYLPSFVVIITAGVSFFNIPIYIVKYRNSKFLKRLKTTPLSPLTILLSLGLANLLMLLLGLILLVAIGVLVYGASFQGNPLALVGCLMLSFAALGSIGLILASLVRGLRTANVLGQLIYYPMIFFSGAVPLKLGSMEFISYLLPITYAVELNQRLWNKEFFEESGRAYIMASPWGDVAVLGVTIVLGFVIAVKAFKWE